MEPRIFSYAYLDIMWDMWHTTSMNEIKCFYCNEKATTIDHMHPKSKGGTNNHNNLVPCCHGCNSQKGNRSVEQFKTMLKVLPVCPKCNSRRNYYKQSIDGFRCRKCKYEWTRTTKQWLRPKGIR